MIKIRKSHERGKSEYDWLHAKHTFSFNTYYDDSFMNFRKLRVINEDVVEPGQGFPTHGHHNMEIVTYVLEGALEHKDSLGNGSVIRPGEVQLMSAGKGIQHSEFNHSQSEKLHLLQIWIESSVKNTEPSYEQVDFSKNSEKIALIVSDNSRNGSLKIKQNAKIYRVKLPQNDSLNFDILENRHLWIQIARGSCIMNTITLEQGDGASVSKEINVQFTTTNNECEFLIFDLN